MRTERQRNRELAQARHDEKYRREFSFVLAITCFMLAMLILVLILIAQGFGDSLDSSGWIFWTVVGFCTAVVLWYQRLNAKKGKKR